jgi:Zn-dependent metalloprotease
MEERMKPLLLLITTLFFGVSTVLAQEKPTLSRTVDWEQFKTQEGANWDIRWNEQTGLPRVLRGQTTTKYAGEPLEAAKAFLSDHKELFAFKETLSDLQHVKTKTHRGVRHVTFQQNYEGLSVEGAQYKVHIREDGTVDMANGYYYNNINIPVEPAISSLKASNTAMADLELEVGLPNKNKIELVVYPDDGKFLLSYKVEVIVEEPFLNWKYFIDAMDGNILNAYNKIASIYGLESAHNKELNDDMEEKDKRSLVAGTGKVYLTHPGLSSVTTESLLGLDGNGKLDGTYVRAKNSSSSDAYSATHTFHYSTSNTHFDETNLYYHVDHFRRNFIEGLDSGNGLFNFIEAYAHNNTICPNNACFNPNYGDIYFSDGSPFAKEDKVIHHEYSHKVFYDIESGVETTNSVEGAISEGVPDYFAGSFTGRSKILNYAYPSGTRNMSMPIISSYSQYLNQLSYPFVDAYLGAEFFSSILWDIRGKSGITAHETDELVFDALFRISSDPNFYEFKDAMIAADYVLNYGVHHELIQNAFADKGIGTYFPLDVSISGPTSLTPFQPGTWNSSVSGGVAPYSYVWQKRATSGIGNWTQVGTSQNYSDSDNSSFQLMVSIIDVNGKQGTAQTTVSVSSGGGGCVICKQVALPTDFAIKNNYPNPFNPSTQIKFELPEAANVSIKVYNIVGQEVATLVNDQMQAGFHNATFKADNLASGVYIARLTAIGSSDAQFVRELKMQLIK